MMTFLAVAAAFALGAFVQTIAGFGSALVAMPILTQFLGVQAAAGVMSIVGATVIVVVLFQNRRGLRWREAGRLLCGTVVGIPVGAWALTALPAAPVVGLLGVLLIAYALHGVRAALRGGGPEAEPGEDAPRDGKNPWRDRITGAAVGFCAGLLGGAYATDGPPLVMYGAHRRWPKETFRAVLQACFLVDGLLILAMYSGNGVVNAGVLVYCLYGVPGMLLGLAAGTLLDPRINRERFHRLLLGLVFLLGAGLLARALFME